jgi:Ca2+/Na+ antiporter
MYGGHKSNSHVAYVGIAGHLKRRIKQHLIRRDSSVTTGTSVLSLTPELVTKLHWWNMSLLLASLVVLFMLKITLRRDPVAGIIEWSIPQPVSHGREDVQCKLSFCGALYNKNHAVFDGKLLP